MTLPWRGSVLECGSPLPLWEAASARKRQGTAALQDLAEFVRFMERAGAGGDHPTSHTQRPSMHKSMNP